MLEIQRAGVKDHGTVTALLLEFARGQGLRPEEDIDRWERVVAELLDSDGWLFLLALDDEEAVGLAAINWFLTLYGSTVDGRLIAIVVDGEHRRRGVGTRLMEDALAAARRRGCSELVVSVGIGDEIEKFYRKVAPMGEQKLLTWRCDG
ncbi:MAG: GNAT family N-acetyltransferase [Candidatus Geothermincolia bacterium]